MCQPRLATLAIGILLGLGVLLAWLRTRPEAGTAGPKRLAVLPFENLGRPEDGYFADGVTDEVRGKLAALPGLEVIARTSSVQYKQTTKSPQQIGRELGVDYLLTGTVRWEKDAGGPSRVRVSPELVQVSTASTKWQAPLTPRSPTCSGCRPTSRPAWPRRLAWRSARASASDSPSGRRRTSRPTTPSSRARRRPAGWRSTSRPTAGRSTTTSAPWPLTPPSPSPGPSSRGRTRGSTGSRLQLPAPKPLVGPPSAPWRLRRSCPRGTSPSAYYHYVVQQDLAHAHEQSQRAWQLAPKDARFLALVAQNELALGHTEEALEHLREAQVLDPRSVETATTTAVGAGRASPLP